MHNAMLSEFSYTSSSISLHQTCAEFWSLVVLVTRLILISQIVTNYLMISVVFHTNYDC